MTETVLTIASSDSSGGAGVSADMKVFHIMGVHGTCAVCNVTAQNSFGVQKIYKVAPRVIEAQIDATAKDFDIKSAKVGMLYSAEAVNCVAKRIKRRKIPNIILDIPIISKNGVQITKERAYKSIVKNLLPLALLITPNIPEAEKLADMKIESPEDIKTACRKIKDLGVENVLIKGGHSERPCDVLYDGESFYEFEGEKYSGKRVHGTGCALSAGICACVGKGMSLPESVSAAKDFINKEIENSVSLGKGRMDFMI